MFGIDFKLLKYVQDQDIDLVSRAIDHWPLSIKYAKVLNQEVCEKAVKKLPSSIFYVPKEYRTDEIIIHALSNLCNYYYFYHDYDNKKYYEYRHICGDNDCIKFIKEKFDQQHIHQATKKNLELLHALNHIDYDFVYKLIDKMEGRCNILDYIPGKIIDFDMCVKIISVEPNVIFDKRMLKFVNNELFEHFLIICESRKIRNLAFVDILFLDNISLDNIERFVKLFPYHSYLVINKLSQNIIKELCYKNYRLIKYLDDIDTDMIVQIFEKIGNGLRFYEIASSIIEHILKYLNPELIYKLCMLGLYEHFFRYVIDLPDEYHLNVIGKFAEHINYIPAHLITTKMLVKAINLDIFIYAPIPLDIIETLSDHQRDNFMSSIDGSELDNVVLEKYKYDYNNIAVAYLKKFPKNCDEQLLNMIVNVAHTLLQDYHNDYTVLLNFDVNMWTYDHCEKILAPHYNRNYMHMVKIFDKFLDTDLRYKIIDKCPWCISCAKYHDNPQEIMELAIKRDITRIKEVTPSECDYEKLLEIIVDNIKDHSSRLFEEFSFDMIDKSYLTEEFICRCISKCANLFNTIPNPTLNMHKAAINGNCYQINDDEEYENIIYIPEYSLKRLEIIEDKKMKKQFIPDLVEKYIEFLRS